MPKLEKTIKADYMYKVGANEYIKVQFSTNCDIVDVGKNTKLVGEEGEGVDTLSLTKVLDILFDKIKNAATKPLYMDSNDFILNNPVLAEAQFGIEADTGKIKIGDGFSEWVDLKYSSNDGSDEYAESRPVYGTAESLAMTNPVINSGQVGVAEDTGKIKIGDGVTPWNDLEWIDTTYPPVMQTSRRFAVDNTILENYQFGIEKDTGKYKIGNGILGWNSLEYSKYIEPDTYREYSGSFTDQEGNEVEVSFMDISTSPSTEEGSVYFKPFE